MESRDKKWKNKKFDKNGQETTHKKSIVLQKLDGTLNRGNVRKNKLFSLIHEIRKYFILEIKK